MSLIYWWPFTSNTIDKIDGKTFTSTNWSFQSGGKIGNCFTPSWTDSNTISRQIYAESVSIPETFSVAVWVKNNNNFNSPRTYCPIQFSNGDCWLAGADNKGWDFSHNSLRLIFNNGSNVNGNAGNAEVNWGYNPKEFLGNWYHIAFTVNKTTRKAELFINGISKGIKDLPSAVDTYGGTFKLKINWVQGWMLDGSLNDLRIYDHALSKAEVKELSKALVVHYTFNDVLAEPTTNYSNPSQWSIFPSYWTLLANTDSGFKIKKTSDNAETTVAFSNGSIYGQMAVGDIWTTTCYLYKNNKPYKSSINAITNYGLGISVLNFESRDDGYYSSTFKINSKSNAYLIHARIFGDTVSEDDTYEIKFLQFEKKDHATPYTPSYRESMMCNETGLAQPSTKNNIVLSTDSGVGTYSLNCQGSTEIATSNICDISHGTTASFWVKGTIPADSRLVFADSNSKTAFGFFNNGQAIITCAGYGYAHVSDIKTGWKTDWNHIVVTRDSSGNVSCYLNNNKLTLSSSQEWTHTVENTLSIGCRYNGGWTSYFTGLIDDFRFYATCLSVDDIKDLYQTKASISKKGNILCNSFIEGKSQINVTRKSTFECDKIYEEIHPDYERLDYIQNPGNYIIDTGWFPTYPMKATIKLTTTTAASSDDGVILGANYNSSAFLPFYIYRGNWYLNGAAAVHSALNNTYYEAEANYSATVQTLTINGSTYQRNDNLTPPNCSIWLFDGYWPSQQVDRGANIKLHELTIIASDGIKRHFIPVRRKSDGVVGMFDVVNKVFYSNTKSGNFTAGKSLCDGTASIHKDNHISAKSIIEIY